MSENSTHTQSHIDSIAKQEHEFLQQRTLSERVSDRVGGFAGSMFFVLFHILLVVSWVLINANRVSWIRRFDTAANTLKIGALPQSPGQPTT